MFRVSLLPLATSYSALRSIFRPLRVSGPVYNQHTQGTPRPSQYSTRTSSLRPSFLLIFCLDVKFRTERMDRCPSFSRLSLLSSFVQVDRRCAEKSAVVVAEHIILLCAVSQAQLFLRYDRNHRRLLLRVTRRSSRQH